MPLEDLGLGDLDAEWLLLRAAIEALPAQEQTVTIRVVVEMFRHIRRNIDAHHRAKARRVARQTKKRRTHP